MADYVNRVLGLITEFFRSLSPARKLALSVTAVGVLVGIVMLFSWASEKTYVSLMTGLTSEDAAVVVRLLGEKSISYRVDPTGKNISVPPEVIDNLRLELATMGIPQTGTVGYEVFDKQALGTTSFVQKINQKRALEGELMRTINNIKGVKRSRIHLAIPQKSTFVEDQKKASASVVLDMLPGSILNERQIYGIGNLVARAVEGLDPADVVIVDSLGKLLSKNQTDSLAQATVSQLEFKQKFETDTEKRVEAILGHVVGDGHVVARVSADLDFSQINETQTSYDADGSAVLSVQKDTNVMDMTRPGPQMPAGAASNLPGQTPQQAQAVKNNTNRNTELTNYKVPQTVKSTLHPMGAPKRLSVAVVIDQKTVKTTLADGTVKSEVQPWSPEKLKEFEDIIAETVGLDRKRGDTLEVKSMEFTREDLDEAQRIQAETDRKTYIQNLTLYAVIGLVIVLFFMFVVRPFIKWMTENTTDSIETYLPQTIEELERINKNTALPGLEDAVPQLADRIDPEKVEGEMIKEKIITLVETNPHKAALILRDWLHEGVEKKGDAAAKTTGGKGKSA